MKRFIVCLSIAIAIGLIFTFCSQKDKTSPLASDITYETIRVVKKYHLDNDPNKPSCSIRIAYMHPEQMDSITILKMIQELNFLLFEDGVYDNMTPQQAVNEYVLNYIIAYKDEAANSFGKWNKSKEDIDYYSYYKIIESDVLFSKNNLVSYQVKISDHKGGIKTLTTYRNLVFDLDSGIAVSEQNIFVDGYRKPLSQLLKNKLLELYKLKSADELLAMGYFDVEDMSPNNNFSLNDKGITYVYNEREIAVSSLGETRILLLYKELNDILKPNTSITTLSGK